MIAAACFLLDVSGTYSPGSYRERQLALVRSRIAIKVGVKIERAAKVVIIAKYIRVSPLARNKAAPNPKCGVVVVVFSAGGNEV